MMNQSVAGMARMLENYQDLIRSFVTGERSADEFEVHFLARFKNDPNQVTGREFDILDELFADVDDYVSDPSLRAKTGGLDGDELQRRARDAYTRLYHDRV